MTYIFLNKNLNITCTRISRNTSMNTQMLLPTKLPKITNSIIIHKLPVSAHLFFYTYPWCLALEDLVQTWCRTEVRTLFPHATHLPLSLYHHIFGTATVQWNPHFKCAVNMNIKLKKMILNWSSITVWLPN